MTICSGQFWRWGFWVRLGCSGRGLYVSTEQLLFSEREGYTKIFRLGRIKVKFLKPTEREAA